VPQTPYLEEIYPDLLEDPTPARVCLVRDLDRACAASSPPQHLRVSLWRVLQEQATTVAALRAPVAPSSTQGVGGRPATPWPDPPRRHHQRPWISRTPSVLLALVVLLSSITASLLLPQQAGMFGGSAPSHSPRSPVAQAQEISAQQQAIVATARHLIGSPYSLRGSTPATGFSPLGFVHYVYTRRNGVPVGATMTTAFASGPHVSRAHLHPADLVFFSGTMPGLAPLSHVAIYVGGGKMIAPDAFSTGVRVDDLGSPYWSAHYAGATRPRGLLLPRIRH